MKLRNLYYILICLLTLTVASCEEANDWEFDPSHDRLFRPTKFEVSETGATYVQLDYKGVTSATKYVFEFSEGDSLLFNNIIHKVDIPADTLTAYEEETSVAATKYRTIFKGLNGTTRYSVRVKAINEKNGMESDYAGIYFFTPSEQIFTNNTPGVSNVTLNWEPGLAVTHVLYGEIRAESDTVWAERKMVSDTEKQTGSMVVDGLKPGTNYAVSIYNEKFVRGSYRFKTLGSSAGKTIYVQPTDNVNDLLTAQVAEGITEVSLIFAGGQRYAIEKMTIPEGINHLYMVGDVKAGGALPELYLHQVALSAPMGNLSWQYVDLNADMNSSNYMFNIGNTNCFTNIGFEGCTIRNIGRSLVYLNKDDLVVEGIKINNCIVDNVGTGGYGMLNISKASVKLGLISITNTTMMDIGDQLMQTKNAVESIIISKSIFCNYEIGIGKIFRFDKQPVAVSVTSTIFTGDNKGVKVNSGNGDYSAYLDFTSCYLTSDFVVDSKKFTNATAVDMTSEELFVDPRNGDFHIKEGVKFTGAGKVGDPRWW